MMLPRFYVPDLDPAARQAALPEDEGRHLTRVLRLGTGDEIAVFDGRGREFRARVTLARRGSVQVDVLEPIAPAREPRVAMTLAQAVLKGEKMDAVIRDATMMGVAAVEPIITGRSAMRLGALERGHAAQRWRRVAVASAKQCRRAIVPAVGDGQTLTNWLTRDGAALKILLVEPEAAGWEERSMRHLDGAAPPASVSVLVGPEGGWSVEERQMAIDAGFTPVTLGGLTLRADAVPVAALAIIRFVFGDM